MMTESNVKQRKKKEMPVSPGRPKGVPNKTTTEVKQMILDALAGAGGVDYLIRQAEEKPAAFLALVGKVMPMQVVGDPDAPLTIQVIQRVVVDPAAPK